MALPWEQAEKLLRRRGMQSPGESRVARFDPQHLISLQFLLWHLCMQRWQPKITAVCREEEGKCCVDSACLRGIPEASPQCPPKTRQGVIFRENTKNTWQCWFLSPVTPELSCCCFTAPSAPAWAQTPCLEPAHTSQWVMCPLRPLQKHKRRNNLCFLRRASAGRLGHNGHWRCRTPTPSPQDFTALKIQGLSHHPISSFVVADSQKYQNVYKQGRLPLTQSNSAF